MPAEIEAFLNAYKMKFICLPCPGAVTGRDEVDVRSTVEMLRPSPLGHNRRGRFPA
jgi:hypothetical protein